MRTCWSPPAWTISTSLWRQTPAVLELEHYTSVKRQGNWAPSPGSSLKKFGKGKSGQDFFRGAPGICTLGVKLHCPQENRDVRLALNLS